MKQYKYRYFMGDFETTVYANQTMTEVWASACVELGTEDVEIFHSIGETYDYLLSLNTNLIIYYHNLKFDGSFWLSYLLTELNYEQAFAYYEQTDKRIEAEFQQENKMKNKTFKYTISNRGQWYSITIKDNNHYIVIRDSLKLLPFSVKKIGQSFGTKHKKLDMEYTGFRYAGCAITDEEKEYIKNDVLVVKEALEILFNQGHKKLTIGSCCLSEYKLIIGIDEYNRLFPDLYKFEINQELYGYKTAGDYIRKSYRGGWCYLVKGKEQQIFHNGTTADVNSLYPSMMSNESGNIYPYGFPTFWKGNYIPDEALGSDIYYFIRVKTRFYIKDGYLPFIQAKSNFLYPQTESLTSSDVYDPVTQKYYSEYIDDDGSIKDTRMTLTMTMTDFILLKEHYNLVDFEILDGCYFKAKLNMFEDYMSKYKNIKMNSKGAVRELAKLFLNNLYGKMASSTDSSFKIVSQREDTSLGFIEIRANEKKPGYIPVGSAITSYSRNFTIRAAQQNYHGIDKPGFIYADTDSIHCDLKPEEIKGIKVSDNEFCCWKLESCWDEAYFTRQKTYIEHITHSNLKPVDTPYYDIKCAGMPDKCKQLFLNVLNADDDLIIEYLTAPNIPKVYRDFMSNSLTLNEFNIGLKIPGKLLPKRIPGGVVLTDTTYEMR